MVYSVGRGREGVRDLVMATRIGTERSSSKPPLHNFDLPFLKWGNQRHLRCMKLSDSNNNNNSGSVADGITADRFRTIRSPPSKFLAAVNARSDHYELRQFKKPKQRNDGSSHFDEGISQVREKLMFDFKVAADKMKDQILRKGGVSNEGDDDVDEDEAEEESHPSHTPPPAAQPASVVVPETSGATEQEARPWNLRTRRAACKAPAIAGTNSGTGKGLKIEDRKASNASPLRSESAKSPRLREKEEENTEQVRQKFAVALSKKEIEDDFMALVGHRPARRPKKRPRYVQKQLDSLFPGLWLSEVTVDIYKVPELPDNGKR